MGANFPGLGVAGFRSFGSQMQFVAPLERVNVLIGPNNSGKSTSLELFRHHLMPIWTALQGNGGYALDTGYRRRVDGEFPTPFAIAWPVKEGPLFAQRTSSLLARLTEFLQASDASGWPVYTFNDPQTQSSFDLTPEYRAKIKAELTAQSSRFSCRENLVDGGKNQALTVQTLRWHQQW
jgi:hypothetical protein